LFYSAVNGRVACAMELVRRGCDVVRRDGQGRTAAAAAKSVRRDHVAEALWRELETGLELGRYADCGSKALGVELLWVAHRPGCVKLLIEAGADLEIENEFGMNPLMGAATEGCLESVRLLIAAGASIEAKDTFGRTALMRASTAGKLDCLIELAKAGAGLDAVDKYGMTALLHAAANGNMECAKALAGAGCGLPGRADRAWEEVLFSKSPAMAEIVALVDAERERRALCAISSPVAPHGGRRSL
jgi:hypothetical protein